MKHTLLLSLLMTCIINSALAVENQKNHTGQSSYHSSDAKNKHAEKRNRDKQKTNHRLNQAWLKQQKELGYRK